jgi:hypothetical protein
LNRHSDSDSVFKVLLVLWFCTLLLAITPQPLSLDILSIKLKSKAVGKRHCGVVVDGARITIEGTLWAEPITSSSSWIVAEEGQ